MSKPDGNEEALLQAAWALSMNKKPPTATQRKKLLRKLRAMQTNGTSLDGRAKTAAAYKEAMRFIETYFANVGRDLTHLKKVDVGRCYGFLVKPWRGRGGREAARKSGCRTAEKLSKRDEAIRLRTQGLTEAAIAKKIDRGERTVRRYLTGH